MGDAWVVAVSSYVTYLRNFEACSCNGVALNGRDNQGSLSTCGTRFAATSEAVGVRIGSPGTVPRILLLL